MASMRLNMDWHVRTDDGIGIKPTQLAPAFRRSQNGSRGECILSQRSMLVIAEISTLHAVLIRLCIQFYNLVLFMSSVAIFSLVAQKMNHQR